MGKIVILENISKVFDQVVAVDNVTLEIEEGEFVTLLGPSGCGKTTTLRTINGLEMPTSGRVYLDGKDVTDTLPEKRPVNMVFQAYALFPHLTIFENIAFGPRIKKWPEDRIKAGVEEMLRLVQLEGYGSRKPDQLSGGQCQRVALARALINQPKVLLLDEPLGALDLKLRKAMQLELRSIQQRLGMTFVYVTHDQEEAMVMSDRIVLMNEGRIVQDGSPTEIYNFPADEFVSRFIGEANLLHGVVESIDGPNTQIDVEGIRINAPTIDNLQDGQPVIVSIRPERVILFSEENEAPPDWPNVYEGHVKNAIFLGPTVRYQISLNEKTLVIADRAAIEGEALFSASETVVVGWEAAHGVILSA